MKYHFVQKVSNYVDFAFSILNWAESAWISSSVADGGLTNAGRREGIVNPVAKYSRV
jgi:hypothetical protein